jgi:hypothetical protein
MLNQDYRDMLSCLKEEKVDFIIVGAYALAAHGNPRATGDIDIWIRNTAENGRNALRALSRGCLKIKIPMPNNRCAGAAADRLLPSAEGGGPLNLDVRRLINA